MVSPLCKCWCFYIDDTHKDTCLLTRVFLHNEFSSGKPDDERLQSSIQCRVIWEESIEELEYKDTMTKVYKLWKSQKLSLDDS